MPLVSHRRYRLLPVPPISADNKSPVSLFPDTGPLYSLPYNAPARQRTGNHNRNISAGRREYGYRYPIASCIPSITKSIYSVDLQDGHERFLRHLDAADRLHALLAFLLFLQQLALTGDITAIALGQYILAAGPDILTGNDLGPDGCLDWNLEHLLR